MTSPLQPPPGSWGGAPVAPAMPPAQPVPATRRRNGLVVLGVVLVVAAVVSAVALLLAASARYDRGAEHLARAPIGCTTTLQFDDSGTFVIYAETVGEVGALAGDCPNGSDEYRFEGDGTPTVDLRLVDPSGAEVALDADTSREYDAAGRQGRSVASVSIPSQGAYELTVTSSDSNFAVAVGKDPKDGADALRTLGVVLGLVLLLAGVVLVALGLRRRPTTAAVAPGAPMAYAPHIPVDPSAWAPAPPTQQLPVAPTQQLPGVPPPPTRPLPPTPPPSGGGGGWAPPPPPPPPQ